MSQDAASEARSWTTAEAAFIVGEPLDVFKKVVERSPVRPTVARRGGASVRCFALRDLVFLRAYRDLQETFTNDGRARLYRELLKSPHQSPRKIEAGDFAFNFGRHLAVVEAEAKKLDQHASHIDASSGEALIKGTSIEAYRVAALLDGGMTVEEVLKDYPSLKEAQVLAARAWALSHPKQGRPFPKRSAKAAMRDVDLSALEEFLGPEE